VHVEQEQSKNVDQEEHQDKQDVEEGISKNVISYAKNYQDVHVELVQ